jgi:adenylate kinase
MGPPGVGKGTQASRLGEATASVHVSTGDILREAVAGGTALGRRVRDYVENGRLVPDDLMGDLIEERLAKPDAASGFVLDGFPRTVPQIATLDRVMRNLGAAIDHVFLLQAGEDEIVRRLGGRRVCPSCNAVYHLESRPPRSAGVCDQCGSALIQRADDEEDVIRERLRVYAEQTAPVAAEYRSRGVLVEIDGTGSPGEVADRLRVAMNRPGEAS